MIKQLTIFTLIGGGLASMGHGFYNLYGAEQIKDRVPELRTISSLEDISKKLEVNEPVVQEAKNRIISKINELESMPGVLKSKKETEDLHHPTSAYLLVGSLAIAAGIGILKEHGFRN